MQFINTKSDYHDTLYNNETITNGMFTSFTLFQLPI